MLHIKYILFFKKLKKCIVLEIMVLIFILVYMKMKYFMFDRENTEKKEFRAVANQKIKQSPISFSFVYWQITSPYLVHVYALQELFWALYFWVDAIKSVQAVGRLGFKKNWDDDRDDNNNNNDKNRIIEKTYWEFNERQSLEQTFYTYYLS